MSGGRSWRIGELAEATGLTVRTLRHYEQVGLMPPAARTEGRQRIYGERDLTRLYVIRALREMGLALPEVRRALEGAADATLAAVLRAHLARVDAELARLGRLRSVLAQASRYADDGRDPDVLATIVAMARVARQGEARRTAAGTAPEDAAARWRALGDELRGCMDAGEPPAAPRVRVLAAAVRERLRAFAGGEQAVLDALARLRRHAPPNELAGWTPELFRYLDEALATLT